MQLDHSFECECAMPAHRRIIMRQVDDQFSCEKRARPEPDTDTAYIAQWTREREIIHEVISVSCPTKRQTVDCLKTCRENKIGLEKINYRSITFFRMCDYILFRKINFPQIFRIMLIFLLTFFVSE